MFLSWSFESASEVDIAFISPPFVYRVRNGFYVTGYLLLRSGHCMYNVTHRTHLGIEDCITTGLPGFAVSPQLDLNRV